MVLDVIANCSQYFALHPHFAKAFDFLRGLDAHNLHPGRYEIDGDDVYAMVQEYTTAPAETNQWEAHRKYIDIQYVVAGNECLEWLDLGHLPLDTPYSEQKDCLLCVGPVGTACKMEPGSFSILFPQDLHKPRCIYSHPEAVIKVVVKIRQL